MIILYSRTHKNNSEAPVPHKYAERSMVFNGRLTCQDEIIVGTAPSFNASRNDWVRPASIGPFITVAPICFGLVLSNANLVIASRPDLNSGLNLCNCTSSHYIIHKLNARKWKK